MTEASSNKTIAKNTMFLYFRMIIVMGVSIYVSRVILQSLGVTDYGIYNVVGGIVTMVGFLNGALGSSTSRFLTYALGTGDVTRLKKTFSACLNLHIAVAIIAIILAETLGLWFVYEKLVIPADRMDAAFWVYQFSIVTAVISFTQVPYNATIISHERMSIYAYVGLYDAISKLAIAYLITVSPIDRLVFFALLLMLNNMLIQLFYRFYTHRRYEECRIRWVKDKELYQQLLGYSGWDLFGNVAVICQGQGMNVLLNMFLGPTVNAARAIAYQIQGATGQFVGNFLVAARPQVIKSFATDNYERMYGITFKAAKFSYLLMLALLLPICFELDFILKIWLGDTVPEETWIFTQIILLNALFETVRSASLMPYHAIGKIKVGNIVGGTWMILALPISYFCLKTGAPPYSVFMIILIINLLLNLFGWWLIYTYVKYDVHNLFTESLLPCICITILAAFIPYLLISQMHEGWFRLITVTVVSELFLMFLIYKIAMSDDERRRVLQIIISRYKNII